MLRNLLYSFFLHFILLVLIYFSSKNFYYYNLALVHSKKPANAIHIDFVIEKPKTPVQTQQPEDIKKAPEVTIVKENVVKETGKPSIEQTKIPTLSTSFIVSSLVKEKEVPNEISNFKYIARPEQKTNEQETKPQEEATKEEKLEETEPNKETDATTNEGQTSEPVQEQKETENKQREIISTNGELAGEDGEGTMELVGGSDDIKNVIKLSLRERINIQMQIKSCYKMAILKSGLDSKDKVLINVFLKRDGNIDMTKTEIVDDDKYKNSTQGEKEKFYIAVENAKNALIFCSPLRNLPDNKYKVWREMSLEFDSQNIQQ
jgi:hypothetical protein